MNVLDRQQNKNLCFPIVLPQNLARFLTCHVCRGGSSLVALADAADADDEQKSSWVGGKAVGCCALRVLIHFQLLNRW